MKPVIPGQSLETNMWQEGNRIHFQTSTVEENLPVLTGKLHFCIIAKFCNIIIKYIYTGCSTLSCEFFDCRWLC